MSARENLIQWKRIDLNDKESMLLLASIFLDEVPITKDYVRCEFYKCQLVKQAEDNPNDLEITDVSNMDMKGSIPTRIMNSVISSMVSKGIGEITSELRKVQKNQK